MKQTAKYAAASRPVSDDPRDVEAWALAEASRRLLDAARNPDDVEGLRAALQLNQRLWTIFQAAITEDDCQMPADLRTNVAALSLMVDRETVARLVDLDVSKLETLININRNVAGGLSVKLEGAPKAVAQPEVPLDAPAPAAANLQPPVASPQGRQPLPGLMRPAAPAAPAKDPAQAPRESLRISI